jgi:hypothetical protein
MDVGVGMTEVGSLTATPPLCFAAHSPSACRTAGAATRGLGRAGRLACFWSLQVLWSEWLDSYLDQ